MVGLAGVEDKAFGDGLVHLLVERLGRLVDELDVGCGLVQDDDALLEVVEELFVSDPHDVGLDVDHAHVGFNQYVNNDTIQHFLYRDFPDEFSG